MSSDLFSKLCEIHADTSRVRKVRKIGPIGPYYQLDFDIILLFGLTETKAQLRWMENVSVPQVVINHCVSVSHANKVFSYARVGSREEVR